MNNERELWKQINELRRELEKLRTIEVSPRWVDLDAPLTSPDWDGIDDYSTCAATLLNLSTVFGAPRGIKSVKVEIIARDSAVWGTSNLAASWGPSAAYYYQAAARPAGGDVWASITAQVNCNIDGNVYYKLDASGAGTMNVIFRVWGYQR